MIFPLAFLRPSHPSFHLPWQAPPSAGQQGDEDDGDDDAAAAADGVEQLLDDYLCAKMHLVGLRGERVPWNGEGEVRDVTGYVEWGTGCNGGVRRGHPPLC